MKTWTLKVNEEELRALIIHHANRMAHGIGLTMVSEALNTEVSGRIHDLTKRLNKGDAEGEKDDSTKITGDVAVEVKKPDPWG